MMPTIRCMAYIGCDGAYDVGWVAVPPSAGLGCYGVMDDTSAELGRLQEELQALDEVYQREFGRVTGWQLAYGPVRVPTVFTRQRVALVYALFNAICFAAGVVFSFAGGTLASLGVALVVGALFSFGAFVAQMWAVVYQRERETLRQVYGDEMTADLKRLIDKRAKLVDRIEGLRHPHQNNTESGSSPSS